MLGTIILLSALLVAGVFYLRKQNGEIQTLKQQHDNKKQLVTHLNDADESLKVELEKRIAEIEQDKHALAIEKEKLAEKPVIKEK